MFDLNLLLDQAFIMKRSSLLHSVSESQDLNASFSQNKINKKRIGVVLILLIILLSVVAVVLALVKDKSGSGVEPIKLRIALPSQSPFQLLLGNSRVLQVLFYSGNDNRTSDDYKTVSNRQIQWSVEPKGIVSIDPYGRLQTLSLGKVKITVKSMTSPHVFDEKNIQVVTKSQNIDQVKKRVINYEGTPANLNNVLQKIVTYKAKNEVLLSEDIPIRMTDIINNPKAQPTKQVAQENGAIWTIENYADESNRTFIKRTNINEANIRDRTMYFIGDRYLPGKGLQVLSIEDDTALGVWVVNSNGEVSHIEMKDISYKQKAELMAENTKKNVMRHGIAAQSTLINGQWVVGYTDNDGLWTSMQDAGQFMRLGALRSLGYPVEQVKIARDSALSSLKAVLLIANIASRNITIDARIRHFINTRTGPGEKLSSEFLKKDKAFSVDEYVGSPADGAGFYGIDAGKTIDGASDGGKSKFSFQSIEPNDWSNNSDIDVPATSKRTLNGYVARTFLIEPLDGIPSDGLYFKFNENGTQTVIHSADKLYDYHANQHPVLDLGQIDLPQILKDFLNIDGTQYKKSDLIYKGDTSTDEIIGHLFIYKIAFDILDPSDPEEKTLRELIVSTMVNLCTCLTNNGYTMVDATGQGTSWGKMTRTFMNSDFTIEDSPIKSLETLLCFKLCYYLTGDQRWLREYEFLIHDQSFRYLQLVSSVWKRWAFRAYNEDVDPELSFYRLNESVTYSEAEITRHIITSIHMSDEQQAYLGYYLAFQLQDNEQYLSLYRKGLQGWWHSISRSENPLWYYIYQLAYPKEAKNDHYGNSLLDISSWQLSRHSIDTRRTSAFIEGSRNDVIIEGNPRINAISNDPNIIVQENRTHISDSKFNERQINYKIAKGYNPMHIYEFKVLPADERCNRRFNGATFEQIDEANSISMLPSTAYTLPFWMGVYHNMIKIQ